MKVAVLTFTLDPASRNIRERLIEHAQTEETEEKFQGYPVYKIRSREHDVLLYKIKGHPVYFEDADKKIDADVFIFATKHASRSGIHSLSVHVPGNWGKAELGGRDRKLCRPASQFMTEGYLTLLNLGRNSEFEIIYECTHHGPHLKKPCMFIEIGSDETTWENKNAGKIIAEAIHFVLNRDITTKPVVFGIGGIHHCPNFMKLVLNHNLALGHVCPKYNLQNLDEELIYKAIKTSNAEIVALDWKGMGKEKERITSLLEDMGIEYKKTKDYP